jgi:chemotaxis family two-component system response regulator PixG
MILTRLTQELDNLRKSSDGELIVYQNDRVVWKLHLVRGKLLYATDRFYPVRRWDRALKQHCPNWHWGVDSSQLSKDGFWECQLLTQGFSQKQLSLIQAKLAIRAVVQECLFELSSYTDWNSEWKPSQNTVSILYQTVALSSKEIQTVLNNATQMQQKWHTAGLDRLSPSLAPTLRQGVDSQTLPVPSQYLNGQFTLWDIALQLEKSVSEVTVSLLPFVEKRLLQWQQISDLPVPTGKQQVQEIPDLPVPTHKQPLTVLPPRLETKPIAPSHNKPLIACIEDSPVLAHTLKKILMQADYRVLIIPEPMRGFSQLIEHTPELILLDLHLPNADGYSICKFLRETPVFKKTPIIILTARNTQVDRFRAKQAGATEFLSKPPHPQELVQMVQHYLVRETHRQISDSMQQNQA